MTGTPASSRGTILTIGHSNHAAKRFIELLRKHGVTAVADVRSTPYSRYNPQFNREELKGVLRENGIAYVFLGKELGGRSDDPRDLHAETGRVKYDRLGRKPTFQDGIERLLRGAREQRIALLCSEKEPLDCHRALLLAPALVDRGVSVRHIGGDGSLEAHGDAMKRLLDMTDLRQTSLLASETARNDASDAVTTAISRREAEVAYRSTTHPQHRELDVTR